MEREYYAQYYEDEKRRVREKYKRKNAIERYIKEIDDEIDLITRLKDIKKIIIKTEWSKSYMWGMIPHTEILLSTNDEFYDPDIFYAEGTASGCGYDKHSSAVADALNQLPSIKKLLMDNWTFGENECLGYGINSYNNRVPRFSGGVGIDCFKYALQDIGFKVTEMHGKTFDGYVFERIEKKD